MIAIGVLNTATIATRADSDTNMGVLTYIVLEYIYMYVCVCARVQIFLLASSARAVCVVIQEGAQPDPAMLKQVLRGRDASPEELF